MSYDLMKRYIANCKTMYYNKSGGTVMSTNINIRVEEELKRALQGYAKLENKTVSEVVLEAIREKLENDYDYKLALLAYESVDLNDKTTLADMCKEAGLDYEAL